VLESDAAMGGAADRRDRPIGGSLATQLEGSSFYASFHHVAARQDIGEERLLQILRIHAFHTDFGQKVRAGDAVDLFFEQDKSARGHLGELLTTAVITSGTTQRFYRFRTRDGVVDYYDERGNTSRKFLLRRPVRCENIRLTSAFGPRRHPLLQIERMHWGEDWACAPGTPVLAAGNGVIEIAGRKGEYGNYIRIRHANGYKTAYGHLRFAAGIGVGARVRQGDVIGYVSTTGLSSGPHVHYEVLLTASDGSSHSAVDPRLIRVPHEHQLAGKDLADFKRERDRIDDLARRNPLSTRVTRNE
jgi:murein DD-endopeptidase MepM/ murein hydrolase activator NlpD